jgi:hypothetical protein
MRAPKPACRSRRLALRLFRSILLLRPFASRQLAQRMPGSRQSARSRLLVAAANDENPYSSVCSRRCKGSVLFCSLMAKTRSFDGGKKPHGASQKHTAICSPAGRRASNRSDKNNGTERFSPCDALMACESISPLARNRCLKLARCLSSSSEVCSHLQRDASVLSQKYVHIVAGL